MCVLYVLIAKEYAWAGRALWSTIKYANVRRDIVTLLWTGAATKNSFCIIHISYARGARAREGTVIR